MQTLRRKAVLTLALVLPLAMAASPALAKGKEGKKDAATPYVLRITLKGQVFEGSPPFELFGSSSGTSLRNLSAAIREAAESEKVSALVVRINGASMGWTQRETLRRELVRFRKSGKPSYCYVTAAGGGDYLLASAAGEVSMFPAGMLEMAGLSMDLVYMKGLLDKLGIRFQELRMGRYKSAVEPLTRSGPSAPVVEQMNSMIDVLYDEFCGAVAENRGLKPVVVRSLVDRALFRADEAKEAGLVDRVEYEDEFVARVLGQGEKRTKLVEAKLGKGVELKAGGLSGLMQMMNELFGGPKRKKVSKNPKIAIIHGTGAITVSAGGGLFGGAGMTSDEMVKLFRRVRKDDTVKAVVFRVSSPGGSALASDLIAREVELTAKVKPVIVSMGDVAASGGYYVSCPATLILAENATITGSIGVIGAIPDMSGMFDKIGIEMTRFSRGKRADMISPQGELRDEGRAVLMKYMHDVYDDFLSRVAEGRSMPKEAVASIAEGRVWMGSQALKLGLIDEIGGLDEALAKAREMGKLGDDHETIVLPEPKTFFDFLKSMSGEDAGLRAMVRSLPEEAQQLLRQVEWVGNLRHERVLAVWPDVVRIK
jgi:protease-4